MTRAPTSTRWRTFTNRWGSSSPIPKIWRVGHLNGQYFICLGCPGGQIVKTAYCSAINFGAIGVSSNFIPASDGVRLALRWLHFMQAATAFSHV